MPDFSYEPRSYNDVSNLSDGWHPGFLLAIQDEPTPENWQMYAQSPRLWRWVFSIWADPSVIATQEPERQSAPTSQKFSPGGRYQASKAYTWACELVGHHIQPGEHINLDDAMPIPCRVKVRRKEQYANITDVEAWTEGHALLTPHLRAQLAAFLQKPPPETDDGMRQPAPVPPPPPAPATQGWGSTPPSPNRLTL